MDSAKIFEFSHFTGFNNVDKAFRLPVVGTRAGYSFTDMETLENVDIDNQFVLSTRPGSDLKLAGTDVHSLWSDGETCLFVDYDQLYRLHEDYTSTSILSGLMPGSRMSYAPWNDRIYLTNGSYIGYYKDTVTALSDPSINYKLPLPAGQRIAYYRGRLYVAKGNVLYISDPLSDHYDIRSGFRVFENDITMLISVDHGLYVADGRIWFVPGAEPEEFRKDMVYDADAIPFTDANIGGENIGDGTVGKMAIWVSSEGICYGDNNGQVKNLTKVRYAMSTHGFGGAAVRKENGVTHYITTLN